MKLVQQRPVSVMPPAHMPPFISSRQSRLRHQGNPLISGAEAYGFIYSGNAYGCVRLCHTPALEIQHAGGEMEEEIEEEEEEERR